MEESNKATIVFISIVLALNTFIYVRWSGEVKEIEATNIRLENKKDILLNTIDAKNIEINDINNQIKHKEKELLDIKEQLKQIKLENNKLKKQTSRGLTSPSKSNFTATAYCGCSKCNGKWTGMPTASGTGYKAGRTVAVDPKVIPLGTKLEINGVKGYVAEDTGSAIKGNIIDVYYNSHKEALKFGRQRIHVKVVK